MSSIPFPVGTRVVLTGLTKAPEHNGKRGVVQSLPTTNAALQSGRQNVEINADDSSTSMVVLAIKPCNLQLEPRTVDSLSVKELKLVLAEKSNETQSTTGMDKSDLRQKVAECNTPEEISQILHKAATAGAGAGAGAASATTTAKAETSQKSTPAAAYPPTTTTFSKEQLETQAEQMSRMSPAQLRQQAAAMRAMDPSALRRMNPALAGMSDAQIHMAAQQMEMMASNPQMMRMATEQIKNMSPEELEQQRRAVMGNSNSDTSSTGNSCQTQAATTATASAASSTTATAASSRTAAATAMTSSSSPPVSNASSHDTQRMLDNLSPEQLQQQVDMLKTMDPATLRRMHPQFRNMSDDQMQLAMAQMEMMASNPEMMKLATEQMKNMSPQDLQAMQQGRLPTAAGAGAPPPESLLDNISAKQMKEMANMLKEHPEMMRQVLGDRQATVSQEQLEAMGNLEEAQLERVLSLVKGGQKVVSMYQRADKFVGGQLGKMLLACLLLLVTWCMYYWFVAVGALKSEEASTPLQGMDAVGDESESMIRQETEFEDEF